MIEEIIQSCEWGSSKFLFISSNVFDPLIYYSHLTPLILVLLFGAFIFLSGYKNILNQILGTITLLLSIWIFGDLVLWATEFPQQTMFWWAILILVEPIIYGLLVYFVHLYVDGKDMRVRGKLAIIIPLLPTIILASSRFALLGFNLTSCDREAVEGILVYYGYIVELVFSLWIVIYGLRSLIRAKSRDEKKKIGSIVLGAVFFLLAFASGNIIGSISEEWTAAQYGLFGIPVFIGFLTYLVVRFKAFDTKLVGAQALVFAIWVGIASVLFIQDPSKIHNVVIFTLLLVIVMGIMLIKSVKREVAARELIETQKIQLEKANARLKVLDKQKTEFVSLASHQLRAPMTAVKGYIALMLEGDYGEIPGKMKEPIQRIFSSTQSLIQIVGDFLDVTRIELGTMRYTTTDFDLKNLLERIIGELKPNIEISQLEFKFDTPEDTFPMTGDEAKLKQVFNNLIDNALKYTKQGWVNVSLEKTTQAYRLTVKDSGVGISQETLPKLFDKFVRAENANEANVTGTGLGLYVAKQMIEKHNGKIWAESEGVGKGSTFIVEIPIKHRI